MLKIRSNIYLPPDVHQRLNQMEAQCVEQLGRRPGRSPGGWRSRLLEAAVVQFDVAAFIAAELAERERRRAA